MTSLEIIILVYAGLMTVVGVAMILRTKLMVKWISELMEETEDLLGMGFWTLIMGLVVLGVGGYHIVWAETLWVVPVLGWIATIKGALLILFPDVFKPIVKPLCKATGLMMFAGLIVLVIGIWLFTLL